MGREDLPSVRAAREVEHALIDEAELAVRLEKAFARLITHAPDIRWMSVCSEMQAEPGMVTFLQERESGYGVLQMLASIPLSELCANSFPIAYWLADTFEYGFALEIDKLSEQAHDIIEGRDNK